MLTKPTCTKNELKLISSFNLSYAIGYVDIISIYRMCVEIAFIENMSGPNVEALRRMYKAFTIGDVLRHTPKFDKLIEFNE